MNDLVITGHSKLTRLVLIFALTALSGTGFAGQTTPAQEAKTGTVAAAEGARSETRMEAAPAKSFSIAGWLPYWDTHEGLRVLREFPGTLDQVSPFWYELRASGAVELAPGAGNPDVIRELRSHNQRIFPTISAFDSALTSSVINDPQKRAHHIRSITRLVAANDFDGIDIDYESLKPSDRGAFSAFIHELSAALHAGGRELITTVHAKTHSPGSPGTSYAHDYGQIGRASDQVRIMAYDEHYSGGPAGPIASIQWVERVVKYAVKSIPREKIILGVPAFGYDWPAQGGRGKSVVHDDVARISAAYGAPVVWDPGSQSPFLRYDAGAGPRIVWFENSNSLLVKANLAKRYNLGGIVFWRLGREDKAIYLQLTSH